MFTGKYKAEAEEAAREAHIESLRGQINLPAPRRTRATRVVVVVTRPAAADPDGGAILVMLNFVFFNVHAFLTKRKPSQSLRWPSGLALFHAARVAKLFHAPP